MENQINIIEIINYLDGNNNVKIKENINDEKIEYKILEKYNSNNFKKFNDFFKGNIDRIGTVIDDNSIYFSVLYILLLNFKKIDNLKRNILINQLKKRVSNNSNDKNLIINSLSSFFNVNIILFSYSKDEILIFYNGDELIPYKNNIFINEFNNNYYPLVYKNDTEHTFKYNSSILKDILNYDKLLVFSVESGKKLKINYNNYVEVLKKTFNIILLSEIENMLQDSESDEKILDNSSEKISLLNLSDEIKDIDEKICKNNDSILKNEIIYKIKTSNYKRLEKETKETLQKYIKLLITNKNGEFNLNSKKSMLVNYLKENII